jgi:elongation factor G
MGSAYKNKGVQLCLDAVCDYLPNPASKENLGFRTLEDKSEAQVTLLPDDKLPFVGYAFKLEENRFGQLTYVRVYQGKLKKGDYIYNMGVQKRMKVSRMVKMHSNEMEDINEASAGEIFAIFGLDCGTGDTLCDGIHFN